MSTQIGYVDKDGHPRATVHIRGTHPSEFLEVDALVDTGFAGFLMLPIAQALPLGLALYGTGDYSLADGSANSVFWRRGRLKFSRRLKRKGFTGVVVLGGDGALVGMEKFEEVARCRLCGPAARRGGYTVRNIRVTD